MNSDFGKLNLKDVGKGCLVAFLTVVVSGVYTSLQLGQFPDWVTLKTLLLTGLGAGVAYLLKNVFTNSDNKVLKPEEDKI